MRVLVCDGQAKQALPVVRDLAAAGHAVHVISPTPWFAAACWSRAGRRGRSAETHADAFLAGLTRTISAHKIDAVLPLKEITTRVLARERERLGSVRLCLPPVAVLEKASHKGRVRDDATAVGLDAPRAVTCAADGALPAHLDTFPLPAVVKPAHGSGVVRYVNTPAQLRAVVEAWLPVHGDVVVQEYICGAGVGFFALYDSGRCVASYTHRRLREYPATGGISVSAESTHDPALTAVGRALLDRLGWHGPAMVECKRQADTGRLHLLEVNTKFWGSLDLALACGLHFPRWTVALAAGEPVRVPADYPAGVRVYWPAPAALAQACTSVRAAAGLLADVVNPAVRSDWDWRDPLPHLVQVAQTAGMLWQTRGRWGAPHGRPDAGAV